MSMLKPCIVNVWIAIKGLYICLKCHYCYSCHFKIERIEKGRNRASSATSKDKPLYVFSSYSSLRQ